MDELLETQNPDEARPNKRVRLEAPLEVTEQLRDEMADVDDWDDVYGESGEKSGESAVAAAAASGTAADATIKSEVDVEATSQEATFAPPVHEAHGQEEVQLVKEEVDDGIPAEAVSNGDDFVSAPLQEENATATVLAETTEIVRDASESNEQQTAIKDEPISQPELPFTTDEAIEGATSTDMVMVDADQSVSQTKATDDPEFMAAAAAQKGDETSEWQFDSSDAESSSDDSSSDSDSDSVNDSSDEAYDMMDPAALAKILMAGDGEDGDGGDSKGKSTADHQPRTTNEVKEVVVEKPDVKVTEDMKITFLGNIERTVENMALIKGATPGEYQVLEGGSVLCTEDRVVIGAVADTFGRVQEPLYSVAFTNAKEVEAAGITHGTKIFYVDSHSTFVFTQPLRNMKGTDASNIHDEEVNEDELEFSDDEAEAEHKRQKKLAKQARRGGPVRGGGRGGGRSFGAPGHDSGDTFIGGGDAPSQSYGGGMSYDDDDEPAEFYQPLKRPDNLAQIMAGGPPEIRQPLAFDRGRGGRGRGDGGRGRGDRGRGRGDRGRGRGDRGRARGSFFQGGQRGGREGADPAAGFKHNAHTYPDQHNSQPPEQQPHALPEKPHVPQGALESYQFNGDRYQYGHPTQVQPSAGAAQYTPYGQQPAANFAYPAGSHVNRAFFQPQQYGQPPQQQYPPWNGQQQQYGQQHQQLSSQQQPQQYGQQQSQQYGQQYPRHGQPSPAPQGAAPPGGIPDIAGILRTLGGNPPQ
ncbi:unnamed protein product [Zymoseptoria tritici ST99CH_3D1]|nr:unnamed protein product [Zymoseptoria tritici ST99CH_3D1]